MPTVSWPGFTRVSDDFAHDAPPAALVVVVLLEDPPHPAAAVAMAATTAANAVRRSRRRELDPITAASLSAAGGQERGLAFADCALYDQKSSQARRS